MFRGEQRHSLKRCDYGVYIDRSTLHSWVPTGRLYSRTSGSYNSRKFAVGVFGFCVFRAVNSEFQCQGLMMFIWTAHRHWVQTNCGNGTIKFHHVLMISELLLWHISNFMWVTVMNTSTDSAWRNLFIIVSTLKCEMFSHV